MSDRNRNVFINDFSQSNALYDRALETIPLASQTFSKSATNVVKGASPLFLERGQGCHVWDVDGNRYVDFILGLLPIVLGHCDPDVDAAIRDQLGKGISFSLATRLEPELAERLVRLIPCAESVRFGKNGSDATSAAIRLARAFTGRDRIAICGYHGWHDWYIGTTTRNLGVPRNVSELSETFPYNDLDRLESILKTEPDAYAAVILEPIALEEPAPGFIEGIRELTHRYGVLLVFDEIVTGFRIAMGGAQETLGVTPDLACFGKAMGNGMPISAIVGRRDLMAMMEDIFFSGTFGGEALSLAAAIATIDKLEKTKGPEQITSTGRRIKEAVTGLLATHALTDVFRVVGAGWWPALLPVPDCPIDASVATSLLRQELVAEGVLMGATFNLCLAHDEDALSETLGSWDNALEVCALSIKADDPAGHLRGEPIRPVFKIR